MLVFEERGKRSTRRKPIGTESRINKLNPHNYDARSGNQTRATLVEGECSHQCTIPALADAPLVFFYDLSELIDALMFKKNSVFVSYP